MRQKNGLTGSAGRAVFHDLKGWAGKMSLAAFAEAMGMPMHDKDGLDKQHMRAELLAKPEEFLRYAVQDARVLLQLRQRFVEFVRQIQADLLHLPPDAVMDADAIPSTQGRLVAETFRRWLHAQAGEYAAAVKFCDRKLGLLDPDAVKYATSRDDRHRITALVRTPDDIRRLSVDDAEAYDRAEYHSTALSGASVRAFASCPLTETAGFNAVVHGGRCHNERPDEYAIGAGLDIDISGCYGDGLRPMVFPVGLPRVWSYNSNDARPTLGEWLARNEDDLTDKLWTCTVTGNLTFEQDLLPSKFVKHIDIRKVLTVDGYKIPSACPLIRREVHNAIITADVLKTLRRVSTKREWREIKALRVVTAAAYLKSDRVAGPKEWCEAVTAWDDPSRKVRVEFGTPTDDRPRVWYGVPLEGFIGRLVDERARCKKDGPPGKEQVIKLFINMVFGMSCSPFFSTCNTVLANNITAGARVGVWMLAKALGLRQTITDGGFYDPFAVPNCTSKKRPGLDTFSRPWEWKDTKRGRRYIALPGLSWVPPEPVPDAAIDAVLAHVRSFWAPYGLSFPFRLSHKASFSGCAYWSKGDNVFRFPNGERKATLRGKEQRGLNRQREGERQHPTFALMYNILDGSDDFPLDVTYSVSRLLKVGAYRELQSANTGRAEALRSLDLRPGDGLPIETLVAVYNNLHMPVRDKVVYDRRSKRKRKHRGNPVPFFEKYRHLGIRAVHQKMRADRL